MSEQKIVPAVAWLIERADGSREVVLSPLTDDTYMVEGDEATPLYAAPANETNAVDELCCQDFTNCRKPCTPRGIELGQKIAEARQQYSQRDCNIEGMIASERKRETATTQNLPDAARSLDSVGKAAPIAGERSSAPAAAPSALTSSPIRSDDPRCNCNIDGWCHDTNCMREGTCQLGAKASSKLPLTSATIHEKFVLLKTTITQRTPSLSLYADALCDQALIAIEQEQRIVELERENAKLKARIK